jgi:hypothetical protein
MASESVVLTPGELAQRWHTSAAMIISMIVRGELAAFSTSPPTTRRKRWRIALDVVLAFERGQKPHVKKMPIRRQKVRRDVTEFY